MARPGITEAQVFEAAETLTASGQTVSPSAIRTLLGTGSYTTISTHLATWRETQSATGTGTDGPEMPEPVERAARMFWGSAWKSAQQSLQSDRDALESARRDMVRERQEMSAEIARLENETTRLLEAEQQHRSAREQAEQKRHDAEEAIQHLRVDNARLEERANAAEARASSMQTEFDKLYERFQELSNKIVPVKPARPRRKATGKSPAPSGDEVAD
ncbi:hypothetical protein CCR82_05380 [Halochromatium salexigens]|uniref:KfrA N-terminal DNA-binding domain-containing protein n=1 Tax=Halochromatium salexigens TaxID=49447 RepID=A0AAJ0XFR8_HALSE|nr:DNA-binding protein [Halochromatium salexigens]MBK5929972.1 hypothetical protein [Halochromatium salexigens]